jgi:hypothetical protein
MGGFQDRALCLLSGDPSRDHASGASCNDVLAAWFGDGHPDGFQLSGVTRVAHDWRKIKSVYAMIMHDQP